MTEPQKQPLHHNNDAKGTSPPQLSPFAQLTKSRNSLEKMQKSLHSIAADQKRAAVAIAEQKVKKTGSGAGNRSDNNNNSSRGLKQKLDREQEGKNTLDAEKQPPPKVQKAETGKVSFASDSDFEDNFEEEYTSTTDRL
eukprot:7081335-Ditylum_brightwellii.AAC.1